MRPGEAGRPGRAGSRSTTGRSSSATTGSDASAGCARVSRTSSIRATYSSSILGTHHIFFPPRFERVVLQQHPDRLSADLVDDAALHALLDDEHDGPSSASLGRWPADHGDDRRFLPRVELPRRDRPLRVLERDLDACREVPFSDPPNRWDRRANRCRRCRQRLPLVQHLQHANPLPCPLREPLPGLSSQQLSILVLELEPGEPGPWLLLPHGTCRSGSRPERKFAHHSDRYATVGALVQPVYVSSPRAGSNKAAPSVKSSITGN